MIELNHTIVPTHNRVSSAQFFARIFGLKYEGELGHFAPVQVNDKLTLDFANSREFNSHHLAFTVSEDEFDMIFKRIQEENIPYGQGPRALEDMQINRRGGGRGLYFKDPNGHVLELLTRN